MKHKLKYWFDNLMSRGTGVLIAGLAFVTAFMIFFVSFLVWITDSAEGASFPELLWFGVQRSLDPSLVCGDTGCVIFICSMFVIALGGVFTKDVLRDWERNGLIDIPRSASGYRTYGYTEMNRLKIIRTLRNAHYSMMSILRMLIRMDRGEKNLGEILNTPGDEEDIVCAADRYCSSLNLAESDAEEMLSILAEMQDMNHDWS